MADRDLKAMTADIDTPTFDTPAFTTPPPLAEATVAIVTTASLHHPDQDDFAPGDTGFRVLDGARRDVRLGHWSPNFDTVGFSYDMNVVFPLDRLDELAADWHDRRRRRRCTCPMRATSSTSRRCVTTAGPPAAACCVNTASTLSCSPLFDRCARVP